MKKMITSRERLLQTARQIVTEEGMEQLNMRTLAQRCGIALGSVYNYFPSKDELLIALAEDFWNMLHPQLTAISSRQSFDELVGELYQVLTQYLSEFRLLYLGQLRLVNDRERQKGKEIEQRYMAEVCGLLAAALEQDKAVLPHIWNEALSQADFARLVSDQMFLSMMQGRPDCLFLQELSRRLLYGKGA